MTAPYRPRRRLACAVDGCDMQHAARGYCSRHYMRWWRTGSPVEVIDPRVASTRGLVKRRSAG